MTTKLLIDRELLERLYEAVGRGDGMYTDELRELRAALATPAPCDPRCAETCVRASMCATCMNALAAPVQGEADYDAELHASWLSRMTEICKEYRTAEDGADVRDVWKILMAHLDCQPASMTALTDGELRAGIAIQRSEIDRLRQQLRDEGDRIAHLRTAMETILPYVKDKRVTGRKPLKDGVYTMHIGQIIRDALDAVQPPASAAPRQPEEDAASILLPALRQYMHNDGSGLLAGYEYERTQQIVAELREECERLRKLNDTRGKVLIGALSETDAERDTLRQQRDKLAGLLADVKADYTHAIHWEDMHTTMKRIDAALAKLEGK